MHTAELRFRTGKRCTDQSLLGVHCLVGALERNGQVVRCAGALRARGRGVLRGLVSLPEADSMTAIRPSKEVKSALAELREGGLAAPVVRVLGHDPDSAPVCRCRRWSGLVLTTHFLDEDLPLRCGDCRGVVPFYRFRHTTRHGSYEDIVHWASRYRLFDELWINSGAGERLAYRQLSSVDSELSREGRAVCRAIEKRARAPVYYALDRYHGRSLAAERRRLCPGCGRRWRLDEPWLSFDFRCRPCRLVSRMACEVGR